MDSITPTRHFFAALVVAASVGQLGCASEPAGYGDITQHASEDAKAHSLEDQAMVFFMRNLSATLARTPSSAAGGLEALAVGRSHDRFVEKYPEMAEKAVGEEIVFMVDGWVFSPAEEQVFLCAVSSDEPEVTRYRLAALYTDANMDEFAAVAAQPDPPLAGSEEGWRYFDRLAIRPTGFDVVYHHEEIEDGAEQTAFVPFTGDRDEYHVVIFPVPFDSSEPLDGTGTKFHDYTLGICPAE